uniref:DUF642 domain-containing protein n=1 Tax=Solibacter usitatus (strain Ellin6076) TaxID=234267 RepID=Q01UP1_SOLUE
MKIWMGAVLCLAAVQIAGATVVNVDAMQYGVQNWGQVGLDGWRYPYPGAPTLTVGPGTYTFSLVNPTLNSGATYTAWTYNSPWITNYIVFDQADESHYLFGGATSSTGYANATDAFNGTCGVTGSLCVSTYSFAATTALVFATPGRRRVRQCRRRFDRRGATDHRGAGTRVAGAVRGGSAGIVSGTATAVRHGVRPNALRPSPCAGP